jgi:hypothetical protein
VDANPAPAAAIPSDEIRAHPTFVEKHQPRGVQRWGQVPPRLTRRGDVRAGLLGRAYRSF